MSQILTENFDFRGHLSTFRAENTPKSRPFKVENNAQTLPKQLQNNFEKVQKTTFSTPKMAKSRMSTWPKVSIFGSIFGLRALFLPCWYQKFCKNRFLNFFRGFLELFRKCLGIVFSLKRPTFGSIFSLKG